MPSLKLPFLLAVTFIRKDHNTQYSLKAPQVKAYSNYFYSGIISP